MSHLIDHFKNIIKFVMEKLFSLYFCFKNNGSLALLLKKKKKFSDPRDEGIKLIS